MTNENQIFCLKVTRGQVQTIDERKWEQMLQKLNIFKGDIENNDNFHEFFLKEASIINKDLLSLEYFLKYEKDKIQK